MPTNIWKNAAHNWSLEKCNQNHIEIPSHASWNGNHKKIRRKQMLERMWKNRNAFTLLECKLVQPLWTTVWQFLRDLEIEIPFDPADPLLGIYPKDYILFCYKDTCTHVYCSTVHNSKDLEPTQMPISDRLDKENVAHIHHGRVCSHKK